MTVRFGLEVFLDHFPPQLTGKRLGVLCHSASINSRYEHIVDLLAGRSDCTLAAIFGPQHGLYGQTQDNMIEWEGTLHPRLHIPVYSLYGKTRKPSSAMLAGLDALVIDLQDVGARPYTYVWTVKLCLEACAEIGLPVWVLDRPNPIAALDFDGPMLDSTYFSFVGGAVIPLCHRMTMSEMAQLIRQTYCPGADLHCVAMEGWWRNSLWNETGLPWVLPSPNMPTLETAIVYPGMVFFEATNVSEGRGTSRPFEIVGAPYFDAGRSIEEVHSGHLNGCIFREHGFIPTFNKWQGTYCNGLQVHVTDPRQYRPVMVAVALIKSILRQAADAFQFKAPPYEYETEKMPFDILAGSAVLRRDLLENRSLSEISASWGPAYDEFRSRLQSVALYPEERP